MTALPSNPLEPVRCNVVSGRSETFVCADCKAAHRFEFSIPVPGEAKIGLRVSRDEQETTRQRDEWRSGGLGGSER